MGLPRKEQVLSSILAGGSIRSPVIYWESDEPFIGKGLRPPTGFRHLGGGQIWRQELVLPYPSEQSSFRSLSGYPFPLILTQATKTGNALWPMFFVMGVVYKAWVPRIPKIMTANSLTIGK